MRGYYIEFDEHINNCHIVDYINELIANGYVFSLRFDPLQINFVRRSAPISTDEYINIYDCLTNINGMMYGYRGCDREIGVVTDLGHLELDEDFDYSFVKFEDFITLNPIKRGLTYLNSEVEL